MIAFVKGILDSIATDRIVVENNGIGFEILVPASVLNQLPYIGDEVKILTYMNVKEDDMQLFGFLKKDDLDMFKLLITVNGIGPKGALAILSTLDADGLRYAILSGDSKTISKAPGIGAKTASRVILDLKDKCHLEDVLVPADDTTEGQMIVNADSRQDAIEALVSLGYSATEAKSAVNAVKWEADMTVEEILKQSLKNL